MELRPLTARSVVLSTLLGSHPPRLRVKYLIRVGELFGVAEGTIRVALSRMVAVGDLVQVNGSYQLTERLLQRQARQDESRSPRTRRWDGIWELAVITADSRPAADRAALRQTMAELRLAELREGIWLRPANLLRARPETVTGPCEFFESRPERDPRELTATLWDLGGWVRHAHELRAAFDPGGPLVQRFTVAAAVLRHLLADPLLPLELLPVAWPGAELRSRYDDFQADLLRTLNEYALT